MVKKKRNREGRGKQRKGREREKNLEGLICILIVDL